MTTTSVTNMKSSLSELLRLVKGGEEIVITERGAPIARVVPIQGEFRSDARLADLVAKGLMRPGTGELPEGFWDMPRPSDPEGKCLAALLDERSSGL